MDMLASVLDGEMGPGDENWRRLYVVLNDQNVLTIEDYELDSISSNCHIEIGKNVVGIMCTCGTLVQTVLKFAMEKQRNDITEILQHHGNTTVSKLSPSVKYKLQVYIGKMKPKETNWAKLCGDYLNLTKDQINEIKRQGCNQGKSPTQHFFEIFATREPTYPLVKLYNHLVEAKINRAANILALHAFYKIAKRGLNAL